MKKITFIVIAFITTGFCLAQTKSGNILTGTSVSSLSFGKERHSISLSPSVGFFLADGFALGVSGSLITSRNNVFGTNAKAVTYGIGSFIKFYFSQKKITPFLSASKSF